MSFQVNMASRNPSERASCSKRKSEDNPERSSKRSRTSFSPSDIFRWLLSEPSTSGNGSNVSGNSATPDKPGGHTECITSTVRERKSTKRKSVESPERPSKRSRTSKTRPSDCLRLSFSGASRDADSILSWTSSASLTSASFSSDSEEERSSKRKSEETRVPTRKDTTCPSVSEEPCLRAASDIHCGEGAAAFPRETSDFFVRQDEFDANYGVGQKLGEGGFGSVYAAYRKTDYKPVAIKFIKKFRCRRMVIDGKARTIPLEVALLLQLQPAAGETSAAVILLDWFILNQQLVLVLERPGPCMDLYDYRVANEKQPREKLAKTIMQQVVDGFTEVHSKGVFHGDIKLENILVETRTKVPRARIIDFGCGTFLSEERFYKNRGTALYTTPEYYRRGWSMQEATTVWQIGVMMYELLHSGALPFKDSDEIAHKDPQLCSKLSDGCRDFLLSCLNKRPEDRATLKTLKDHPWLK